MRVVLILNTLMNTNVNRTTEPNPDAIALSAYLLWEKEGCPANRDQEYWFKAEKQLRSAFAQKTAEPTAIPTRSSNSLPEDKNQRNSGARTKASHAGFR